MNNPHAHPPAFTPIIRMNRPNEVFTLYRGPATLRGTSTEQVDATVDLVWLPDPDVIITAGQVDLFFNTANPSVRIDVGHDQGEMLVVGYLASTRALRGHLKGQWYLGPTPADVTEIHFGLVNFHQYVGSPISSGGAIWSGRLEAESESFTFTIDQVHGAKLLFEGLDAEGGYAITHAGRVQCRAGVVLTASEMKELTSALNFLFAFVRGFWCGPVVASTEPVLGQGAQLLQPWLLTRWRNVGTWFPGRPQPGSLDALVSRFLSLWADTDWQTPLRHYVWWYVEANSSTSLESAIITAQTALELMGWVHLVETRGIISADGYHNLPASDKLRVLLADLRIPTAIPAHQTHLQQFASAFNHVDGPAAVVDMRNSIVHPNVKRRTRLLTAGTMAKFEAAELVRQYVEFVLLAQLGYTGYVKDRTARTSGRAAAMPVPWA